MSEKEKNHNELLEKMKPIIEFLEKNNYHFMFVAGKDEVCTRYLIGSISEIEPMITGMCKKNDCVKKLIKEVSKNFKND